MQLLSAPLLGLLFLPGLLTAPVRAQTPITPVAAPIAHRPLRVAVYEGPGASGGRKAILAALAPDTKIQVDSISVAQILAGKLAEYDVVIHPGGSGGGQGKALGEAGREKERAFVQGGGGYIGVCGGAYLATCDYPWSLGVLNARVVDKKHWARGHGPVQIAPTSQAQGILGVSVALPVTIIYWQGPLLAPAQDPKLPAYDELARFETEIADKGAPKGVMKGLTAVAAATFGNGRVVCFSPHPEKSESLYILLQRAVAWAAPTKPDTTTSAQ